MTPIELTDKITALENLIAEHRSNPSESSFDNLCHATVDLEGELGVRPRFPVPVEDRATAESMPLAHTTRALERLRTIKAVSSVQPQKPNLLNPTRRRRPKL
jgi:hypothetical protein